MGSLSWLLLLDQAQGLSDFYSEVLDAGADGAHFLEVRNCEDHSGHLGSLNRQVNRAVHDRSLSQDVGHIFKNEIANHPSFVDILCTRKFWAVDDLGEVVPVKLTSSHHRHVLRHRHLMSCRGSWLTGLALLRVVPGWSLVRLIRGSRCCSLELLLLLYFCLLLSDVGK